jgi:hypothetical protein
MYEVRPNLVIGFHGCDIRTRTALLKNPDSIVYSEKPYDWLGHGMYFWENNYERAMQWAKEKKKRGEIKTPAIIGGVFTEGGPAFPGAGIPEKSHIQICIRNANCIQGLFLPRNEIDFSPEAILKEQIKKALLTKL